jgi:hypothetical protein
MDFRWEWARIRRERGWSLAQYGTGGESVAELKLTIRCNACVCVCV